MKKKENIIIRLILKLKKIILLIKSKLSIKNIINFFIIFFVILLYIFVFLSIYTNFRERKRKEITSKVIKKVDDIIKENKDNVNEATINYNDNKYTVLGKLKIDKINIYEPILKENTKYSLDVSVVKIYGPSLNKKGNVVLGGHNFMKGNYFIKIMKLEKNDKITVIDLSGNSLDYYVFDYYKTTINDANYFRQPNNNEKILTLVTCTKGGSQRYVVKAKAN